MVSSLRSSSRNLRRPRSRSHISAAESSYKRKYRLFHHFNQQPDCRFVATFIGISGGNSSSEPESAYPFAWRPPFNFEGSNTMSGVSAYDLGSVRGRNERRVAGARSERLNDSVES